MIYFDYAATTPCLKEVVEEMTPYWNEVFGNASSRSHQYGWEANEALEKARKTIADILKVTPSEIIFTSGATESNNLAIKGFAKQDNSNKKIACTVTEHKCVIDAVRSLKNQQKEIDLIPVTQDGLINYKYLESNIKSYSLISTAYVNNETGVQQDIQYISKLCKANGVKLHTDAAQAFGKIEIDAKEVDMLSISGHKIYGPKGIGVLYISKHPKTRIIPLISGGGQENNLRSGTVAVPLCIGIAKAAKVCNQTKEADFKKYQEFQTYLIQNVIEKIEYAKLNGKIESKLPNIVNISIPYIEGESLIMKLNQFAISSGSACASKSLEPSYVISSMYPNEKEIAHSSIRISFGKPTTLEDVKKLSEALIKYTEELREISPLWKMIKQGIDLKKIKWVK